MTPQQIIKQAYDQIAAMKGKVGVDPKWLNKTIARLEEAELFATKINRPGSLADTPEAQLECTCPFYPAAMDVNCPEHGKNR